MTEERNLAICVECNQVVVVQEEMRCENPVCAPGLYAYQLAGRARKERYAKWTQAERDRSPRAAFQERALMERFAQLDPPPELHPRAGYQPVLIRYVQGWS